MSKLISKTKFEKKFPVSQESEKKTFHFGELFPGIFDADGPFIFKESMELEANLVWLGGFKLSNSLFPRKKCPVCGKEEVLIPYHVVGSVLSGAHVIQFYCMNCHERFITNDNIRYFRKIYRYCFENRFNLKTTNKVKCRLPLGKNARLI